MISTLSFFTDTATTEIYTLSLHDALPIYAVDGHERDLLPRRRGGAHRGDAVDLDLADGDDHQPGGRRLGRQSGSERFPGSDRKSTRLNSSHPSISYAVFCLKKKKKQNTE